MIGRLAWIVALACVAPAAAQDAKPPAPAPAPPAPEATPPPATVEIRRSEALDVLTAPPSIVDSRGTCTFVARWKGGFAEPWCVVTDPNGDVFFPEAARLVTAGDRWTATLDFPGDDGHWRVDVIAVGPQGDQEICSFTVGVGVRFVPPTAEGSGGVAPMPAAPPPPPPPTAGGPAPGPNAGEELLRNRRAASIACIVELNKQRATRGLPPVLHDERVFIVATETAREMAAMGAFMPSRIKYKPSTRASMFHGWGIGLFDNYTGSYKSIFDPADVVTRLAGSLARGSMFSKGGVSVGAFGIWDADEAQVYICMALGKDSRDEVTAAAQKTVAQVREEMAKEGADHGKALRRVTALRNMEAAPFLGEVLAADAHPDCRIQAAAALRDLGDPSVIESLIAGLDPEDDAVRQAAGKALESLTGRAYGDDRFKWQTWWSVERDTFRRRK